jgi:hypothetical protein
MIPKSALRKLCRTHTPQFVDANLLGTLGHVSEIAEADTRFNREEIIAFIGAGFQGIDRRAVTKRGLVTMRLRKRHALDKKRGRRTAGTSKKDRGQYADPTWVISFGFSRAIAAS